MKLLVFFLVALIAATSVYVLASQGPDLDDALKSTVVVLCNTNSYGTGWWLNKSVVITAYHVVDGCSNIRVVRGDYISQAMVIASNQTLDIAALRVVSEPPWDAGLKLASSVAVGDSVYAVGYPIQLYTELEGNVAEMSIAPRVSPGEVVWINPVRSTAEISAKTDKGNSGGPVVNEDGDLVGVIVYARPGAVDNSIYMLTVDGVAGFLDQYNLEYETASLTDSRLFRLALVGIFAPLAGILYLRGGRRG
ncbi:MAG: serine protease [Desulfurococcales archaeon]|nr:serine protease [Desulfurococcales archaeon]